MNVTLRFAHTFGRGANLRLRSLATASAAALVAALTTMLPGPAHASTTYQVAQHSPSCSDSGPGDSSTPFCSISAAAKVGVAGDTVRVGAGTYREQVTAHAGVTFQAASPAAEVVGSDSLDSASWSATGGHAWTTVLGAAVVPTQVFAGDTLLTKAAAADQTVTDSWFFEPATHTLYVDLGGAAPAPSDALEVSVRQYGFLVRGVSGVSIQGFTLRRQSGAGVLLDTTTDCSVTSVTVRDSASYGINDAGGNGDSISAAQVSHSASIGIRLAGTTSSSLTSSTATANGYHGISVQGGSAAHVADNESTANITPGLRRATGIDVSGGSLDAVVERNVTHDNDDSGIEIYTGSTGAVVRRNVTYGNGDHGVDISVSANATVVSNTAVDNLASGLNVEGGSTGTLLRDNIAADNAVNTPRSKADIRVDPASVAGTTIDRDLVFQSDGVTPLFEWNGVLYGSLASLRVGAGQEKHGLTGDPEFVNLASGVLQLRPASPALDAADSSVPAWTDTDQTGAAPVDQPGVADSGSGPVTFADLGALERTIVPVDESPVAAVSVDPRRVPQGERVGVDASASSAGAGATTTSYTFTCGTSTMPAQPSPTAACTFTQVGAHTVSVLVTNSLGLTDTASAVVTVVAGTPPTARLTFIHRVVRVDRPLHADASRSQGTPVSHIVGYRFKCGNHPAKGWHKDPTTSCTFHQPGRVRVVVWVRSNLGLVDRTARWARIRR